MAAPSVGEGGYLMGGDVFVFPKTTIRPRSAAQVKLATRDARPETQIEFNTKKGSVPVRLDVDVSEHGRLRAVGRRGAQGSGAAGADDRFPDLARSVRRASTTSSPSTGTIPAMPVDEFVAKFAAAMQTAG